ncbi:MAG: MATE family efflux transporter [Burkholderiales bacterium]|nr:MATE family efflux transporter [Burkholderiales bacterium]
MLAPLRALLRALAPALLRAPLLGSARRIAPLAWPVFVGQLAVLAFATIDTIMVARYTAIDLAALAIGGAAYVTVFVGLMGMVLAVAPIAGHLFGAGRHKECGRQLHQAMWLALVLSVVGNAALLFPQPFLSLSQAGPEVSAKARGYLAALAFALPPALLFTAFRGFNTAVSRPKVVMALQLAALLLKVPLTALLVFGATLPASLGGGHLHALGTPGCGVATAVVMTLQMLAALWVLRRDPFYARFELGRRPQAVDRASQRALLRLGVPMGLSIAIEVSGFTFMAFFISRLGATPVAGHQIALNLVSMMFMLPLAIGNAASALVAQRLGAGDPSDARRLGWHGLELGVSIAASVSTVVYLARAPILNLYTHDAVIVDAALPLLAWVVVFHVADAAQTVSAFVLRAYRVATAPMVIYAIAIWGVGLGGGYAVAFDTTGLSPAWLQGAQGFWSAATVGLVVAALGLSGFLRWMLHQQPTTRPLHNGR